MTQMIELNLNPDRETLRRFGFIALGGFGLVALLAWKEWLIFAFGLGSARPFVAGAFGGLAVLATLLSLVAPSANRFLYVGLALLSYPIGFVVSYLIMGTLFFGLIAPLGIFFRLIGRDSMHRRYQPEATSYWVEPRPNRGAESYFRQF